MCSENLLDNWEEALICFNLAVKYMVDTAVAEITKKTNAPSVSITSLTLMLKKAFLTEVVLWLKHKTLELHILQERT